VEAHLAISEASPSALLSAGYRDYIRNENNISVMAAEAAKSCLDKCSIAPEAIDTLILVTESLWDDPVKPSVAPRVYAEVRGAILRAVHHDLGMRNAQVHGAWMSGCGNFAPAVMLGKSLIESGQSRYALIVCSDRASPSIGRIIQSGNALFSDVASACLIGQADGAPRISKVVSHTSIAIMDAQLAGNFLKVAIEIRKGLLALDDKVRTACQRSIRDFPMVITENLNDILIQSCCATLGVAASQLANPSKPLDAHAFSSDILLSLDILMEQGKIPAGTRIVALSMSSWSLSAIVVEF
jgi:3-oxoacyl-[acyl-carrier-protein] synthase III